MRARFYCRETTGFAYAGKALYCRHARRAAQVRSASRGNFAAAARKRAYSRIVRCFPALFSSIRCLMYSTIFTASFPAIFGRSRNVIFAIPARMQERIYILQLNRISRSGCFRTGSSVMACAAICASRLAAIGSGLVAFLPIVYPPFLPSTVPEDCCRN